MREWIDSDAAQEAFAEMKIGQTRIYRFAYGIWIITKISNEDYKTTYHETYPANSLELNLSTEIVKDEE